MFIFNEFEVWLFSLKLSVRLHKYFSAFYYNNTMQVFPSHLLPGKVIHIRHYLF